MWRDLHFGFRQLTPNKLLTISIILMLAIGIGANTIIFSFINALLLKPLPVRDPQSLFLMERNRERQVVPDTGFYYRQFDDISARKDLFSSAIAEQQWEGSSFVPFYEAGNVRMISEQIVSPNYFAELSVHAILGRVLTPSDAESTSNVPAVISYQFWQSQFNKRPEILGRAIRLKNHPFVIVGILPKDFHSIDIDRAPDIRLPISATPALFGYTVWNPQGPRFDPIAFDVLVRLAPETSPKAAAVAMLPQLRMVEESVWRNFFASIPKLPQEEAPQTIQYRCDYRITLVPAAHGVSTMRTQFSSALLLLMGGVGLLLLSVCANISGLLLAKAAERKREIAIRLSVGASPLRLTGQLFTENLLLAIPGAAMGILLAFALSPILVRLLPNVRDLVEYKATNQILNVTPDETALFFTVAVSLFSTFLFGIVPALRSMQLDIAAELKGNSRGVTQALSAFLPIAVQAALSTILLTGAVLMLRTFWNLEHLNPGFDRAHIVEFTPDPYAVGYSSQQAATYFWELQNRASALPGVRSVALASHGIMRGRGLKMTIAPQGVVLPPKTFLNTSLNTVTPTYLGTMGIPLLAGRNLEESDLKKKPQPVVVNKAFAEFFFPHQNPIGKLLVTGTDGTKPPADIIAGLVGTAKYRSFCEKDPPTIYALRAKENDVILYVRTYNNPASIIGEVRHILRTLDPKVPLVEVETLEQEVQNSLWQERLVSLLSGFFGLVSLFLAGAGLYGALAYSVARRTRELGIRLAIGATLRHIAQTICTRLFAAVLTGLVAGLLAAAFITRLLQNLLFGVQPLDPWAFTLAALCILLCSVLAATIPVFRAMRIDPTTALRTE